MIAFRYSATELTGADISYDSAAANQKLYNCRIPKKPQYDNAKESGDLLNGYSFSHVLWRKRIYSFTISADELDSTGEDFFDNYYVAPFKYICDTSLLILVYIEVVEMDKNVPKTYEEDITFLPEITLLLKTKGTV